MDDTQLVRRVRDTRTDVYGGLLDYVETTAGVVSDRLRRDAREGTVNVADLADDVAWLARQVGRLSRLLTEEGRSA